MATMTLDDVMKLIGDELDAKVAERLGRCPHPFDSLKKWVVEDGNDYDSGLSCSKCGKGDIYGDHCPRYSTDWNAAMRVREWARGLDGPAAVQYFRAVMDCLSERTGAKTTWGTSAVEWIEPIDYARAAILVSP